MTTIYPTAETAPATALGGFTRALGNLADLPPDRRTKTWPQEAVRLALQVARDGEKAVVCQAERRRGEAAVAVLEPRALPWVRRCLPSALGHRRDGERLLFSGDARTWDQARDAFRRAGQEYDKVLALIRG